MKINDILNCINKTLEAEREVKGLQKMLGHFVFHINVQKEIGHIKTFHAYIDFYNTKVGAPFRVISVQHALSCPTDMLEEMKDQVTLMALENLFRVLRFGVEKGAYENFVNGEFQGWS